MTTTPSSERIHIVLAGTCNSGKSSLLNALTGQDVAIVSDKAGTTTDPVRKAIELPGVGACSIVDTPGLDDTDALGSLRTGRSHAEIGKADLIVALLDIDSPDRAAELMDSLKETNKPIIAVVNKIDLLSDAEASIKKLSELLNISVIGVSATTGSGVQTLIETIGRTVSTSQATITGGLAPEGSTVVLVMPQDPQAPRGRLILPQVQTLRELLDKNCTAICCTPSRLAATLAGLSSAPDLVITDSQVFGQVAEIIPPEVPLTSFSVLMAAYKGDIRLFMDGSEAFDKLNSSSRVLIAEACSHVPQNEDIGRVKIPRLLRKKAGEGITIDFASGTDFPDNLGDYDLIIHCGGCMFTRTHVLERIRLIRKAGVPMTNYGILLARAAGILPRISTP